MENVRTNPMNLEGIDSFSGKRMLKYYPPVISNIKEFRALTDIEGSEVDALKESLQSVINNAYLSTMDEQRIAEWEKLLGITDIKGFTLEDRRDVIIARIRGQGKLNTATINSIVNTFTGGTANSWIEDNTLYVEITPPPNNKQYRFESIENELKYKVPAHLKLVVTRNYYNWNEVNDTYTTWQDVKNAFPTWEDVYLNVSN